MGIRSRATGSSTPARAAACFLVNGVAKPKGVEFDIAASDLSLLTYKAGTGTDTLYVKATDGVATSNYTAFTVKAGPESAPIVSASNVTLPHSLTPVALSSLFSASDPDGDAITSYRIFNSGAGNGQLLFNGVAKPKGVEFDVAASDLSLVTYKPGTGTDTLYVKATDGVATSNYTAFTVQGGPESAPVVSAQNTVLQPGQRTIAASMLFSASDPDGDPVSSYRVFNSGAGNGYFTFNGVKEAKGIEFDVAASQLSQLTYTAGAGTDTLYVKASDGLLTSSYAHFTVTAGPQIG